MSSTCPAIVDFIRHLVTNGGQFEKLLFAAKYRLLAETAEDASRWAHERR